MTHPSSQFFSYSHLPSHLQKVSKPFRDFADALIEDSEDIGQLLAELEDHVQNLPTNRQRDLAVSKLSLIVEAPRMSLDRQLEILLEAKDCAVRAVLYKDPIPDSV